MLRPIAPKLDPHCPAIGPAETTCAWRIPSVDPAPGLAHELWSALAFLLALAGWMNATEARGRILP